MGETDCFEGVVEFLAPCDNLGVFRVAVDDARGVLVYSPHRYFAHTNLVPLPRVCFCERFRESEMGRPDSARRCVNVLLFVFCDVRGRFRRGALLLRCGGRGVRPRELAFLVARALGFVKVFVRTHRVSSRGRRLLVEPQQGTEGGFYPTAKRLP